MTFQDLEILLKKIGIQYNDLTLHQEFTEADKYKARHLSFMDFAPLMIKKIADGGLEKALN